MRAWQLLSTRNPVWRVAGGALVLGLLSVTGVYMTRGPRPVKAEHDLAVPGRKGTEGRFGTFVEQLGMGKFALSYDTIQGSEDRIQLHKVAGRLEEPLTTWAMVSPSAQRVQGLWTLMGPMTVEAREAASGTETGKGFIAAAAPALGWDHGVWTGLSTLVWDDLQGNGRGRWTLPPGWHRGLDGVFRVDQGPVLWEAAEAGTLKTLVAQRMQAALGFREGHLEEVQAHLDGGAIQAGTVEIRTEDVVFDRPITFQRADGWTGSASHGQAPRPPEGHPFDQVEFREFQASRNLPDGVETLQALGAERVALASSFGAEDMVILDLLAGLVPKPRVLTLDTGRLPQETYDLMDAARRRYGFHQRV